MSVDLEFNDRVQYTLRTVNYGSMTTTEPIGWKDDEKEYSRHEKYDGIVPKFSNSLKFVGNGANFIQLVKDIGGINEQIELVRDERHPRTDVWTLTYSGFLDLSTWSTEDSRVSVKFSSGGLEQLLKSRESEKVEIDRLTTIDGKSLIPINPISVELEGRRIFLMTKYEVKPAENKATLSNQTNGKTRGCTTPIPLQLVNQSHENSQSPINGTLVGDNGWDRTNNGENGLMFFAVSDKDRILDIKFTLQFTLYFQDFDDINHFRFWVRLGKYKDGIEYRLKENKMLFSSDSRNALHGKTFSVNFDEKVTVLTGESLSLVFDQNMDGRNGHSAHLNTTLESITCPMSINEDSFYNKSQTKAILAHELGERLVTIATNKEKAFYSEFLGRTDLGYIKDGVASLTGVTHGFWARGFDKLPIPTNGPPKIDNLFKPLTTSFKDFVDSYFATFNVGIGIEKIGRTERIRLEEKSFFYNRNVTIRLPNQVKKVKRDTAAEKYYSSLEFGYEQGGDYDEAMGLDEFNAKSTFTTVINRVKNTYTALSKYRADGYGLEFARRKQKAIDDTIDTAYDNDIFLMDLKRGNGSVFTQRKWQDDFEKEPTGVFSPETATNLRFSPFNCLLRHAWWFSAGFKVYLSDFVRYSSSTANSLLKTKLKGKNEYAENGNIINSELERSRFIPEVIEFEHECDFDVMAQVNGTTMIAGREIQNFYGLVEFINEKNEIEKGFFLNLKPNGKGQWKLLTYNR